MGSKNIGKRIRGHREWGSRPQIKSRDLAGQRACNILAIRIWRYPMRTVAVFEARNRPELLTAVEHGRKSAITRHGCPVAHRIRQRPPNPGAGSASPALCAAAYPAPGMQPGASSPMPSERSRLMPFVLDNSVVTGWYLEDQGDRLTPEITLPQASIFAIWMRCRQPARAKSTSGSSRATSCSTGIPW